MKLSFIILFLIVFSTPGRDFSVRAETTNRVIGPVLDRYLQSNTGSRVPVWVFFADKGKRLPEQPQMTTAHPSITDRALKRRQKTSAAAVCFDDIPVYAPYLTHLKSMGFIHRRSSRWFNAVSGFVSPPMIDILAELDFVRLITLLHSGTNRPEMPQQKESSERFFVGKQAGFAYGPAALQLEQIRVPAVHDRGYSGRDVLICVLDTGFWLKHESVDHINKVAEYDFVFRDSVTANQPQDRNNQDAHGTQVLSIVGGKKDSLLYGPAFGADFLLGKTEDMRSETAIEEDNWVAALEWAEALGADIVTTSLGYSDWYTYEDMDGKTAITSRAARKAAAKGVLILVSAGNERDDAWYYITAPADADSIVTVGAVDKFAQITGFSSAGPTKDGRTKPEVVALGQSVRMASTLCPGCYTNAGGTSYAAPLVAGVAALVLEAHPRWTPMQVREALLNTADRADQPDNLYGWGLVNAAAAVDYRLNGDIDHNDRVDRQDALAAADMWLGSRQEAGESLEKADVNGDGVIDILDVVWILRQ